MLHHNTLHKYRLFSAPNSPRLSTGRSDKIGFARLTYPRARIPQRNVHQQAPLRYNKKHGSLTRVFITVDKIDDAHRRLGKT